MAISRGRVTVTVTINSFDGNYYWIPGTRRDDVKVLQYSDCIKIYHRRNLLVQYKLPPDGVKNQQFSPQGNGAPKPQYKPKYRKKPTASEEKKLRGVSWDRYIAMARKENFSHVRLLKYVIEEEYKIKRENSRKMRLSRAKIPEKFVMETFPFDRQVKLCKKKLLSLYDSFDYMSKNQNIIRIGPTGTGKTGLATSFLINAIDNGYNGRTF